MNAWLLQLILYAQLLKYIILVTDKLVHRQQHLCERTLYQIFNLIFNKSEHVVVTLLYKALQSFKARTHLYQLFFYVSVITLLCFL